MENRWLWAKECHLLSPICFPPPAASRGCPAGCGDADSWLWFLALPLTSLVSAKLSRCCLPTSSLLQNHAVMSDCRLQRCFWLPLWCGVQWCGEEHLSPVGFVPAVSCLQKSSCVQLAAGAHPPAWCELCWIVQLGDPLFSAFSISCGNRDVCSRV